MFKANMFKHVYHFISDLVVCFYSISGILFTFSQRLFFWI